MCVCVCVVRALLMSFAFVMSGGTSSMAATRNRNRRRESTVVVAPSIVSKAPVARRHPRECFDEFADVPVALVIQGAHRCLVAGHLSHDREEEHEPINGSRRHLVGPVRQTWRGDRNMLQPATANRRVCAALVVLFRCRPKCPASLHVSRSSGALPRFGNVVPPTGRAAI